MTFDSGALQRLAELRNGGGLAKAGISTSAGLVFYDLEAEAKLLYPVIAPIRKRMPRIGKREPGQGLAVHWNIITDPNSGGISSELGEGQRGGVLTPATAAKISTYHGIGYENAVTWEAEYAGEGYDDIRGIAQRTSLDALILAEEPKLLWGNGTTGILLGQPSAAPTGTGSGTGGSLATGTYYLYAVPLTLQGFGFTKKAGSVITTVSRPNADGTTLTYNGGAGILSAASAAISVTSATSIGSIAAAVAPVKSAAGYAWFVGSTAGAANAYFWGVSTICVVTITSLPTTGQTAAYTGFGTDYSENQYSFDGLITQALSSNGYYNSLAGATLTPDGANGCVEVDTALKYFWDTYKTSPTRMYVGSQVIRDLTRCVANVGTASSAGNMGFRINLNNTVDSVGGLTGSSLIQDYVNKYTWGGAKPIPVELHPNMPDGYIFFDCEINPYPTANIPIARAVRTRRDYFMVAWPVVTRQWQNGIYADECLQVYVPFSMGLISDVASGIT
jgi:hypothetical protein